ncbi:MAG: 50S ribosomal protein L29 [Bryobacteraceae bacterium]
MKAEKVRDLDVAELRSQVKEMTEQIYRLRFQILMGQTDGVKKYRVLRKDRARFLTVLREREVAAEAAKG